MDWTLIVPFTLEIYFSRKKTNVRSDLKNKHIFLIADDKVNEHQFNPQPFQLICFITDQPSLINVT